MNVGNSKYSVRLHIRKGLKRYSSGDRRTLAWASSCGVQCLWFFESCKGTKKQRLSMAKQIIQANSKVVLPCVLNAENAQNRRVAKCKN